MSQKRLSFVSQNDSSRVIPEQERLKRLKTTASHALAVGRLAEAIQALSEATELDGSDPYLHLSMAGAYRALGNHVAALGALEQALAMEPKLFLGLLMKGSLQEREGETRSAAITYGRALAQLPHGTPLDAPTQKAVEHARKVHHRYVQELSEFVKDALEVEQGRVTDAEARRVDLFVDATLGVRRIYRQEPTDYYYPGLPAVEFHERNAFPWLAELEASTGEITEELQAVMGRSEHFTPYVSYPDGVPLDQWSDLNRSTRWSAYHFFNMGRREVENCKRCPKTTRLLERLPQPQVQGRMPAAMFSVLRARTRIPPHTGVANIRLVVHLPLIVPPGCGFRVGNVTREWKVGEAWVFDDTIEHEAWNDSDEDRVVMIFDVWNPLLSEAERRMVASVMTSIDRFNGIESVSGGNL